MKLNVITEIIRKVVREEVQKAIRSELRKSVKSVDDTTSYTKLMSDKVKPKPVKTIQSNRIFTKNKALNDILNETAGGIPHDSSSDQATQSQSNYRNLMNKEMFGTNDMGAILNKKGSEPNVAETTIGNAGGRPTKELEGVLNKNYSDVLKAMKKTKQGNKIGIK